MRRMTKEQALAIVRKDERNEPPTIPDHEEPGYHLRHGPGTLEKKLVHNTSPKAPFYDNQTPMDRSNAVVEAVEAEIRDRDTAIWFASLCESGPDAIEAQAWQIREALRNRGVKAPLRDVQDAMLQLAHELLPNSPAGLDPRDRLTHDLGVWATGQPQEVQDRLKV